MNAEKSDIKRSRIIILAGHLLTLKKDTGNTERIGHAFVGQCINALNREPPWLEDT
jgi:hypothetical protein